MEEQIVQTLIDFYKDKGIDLYAVIDDPLFTSLPIAQKIKVLKQFASHIGSGTSRGLNKADIRAILTDAGFAAGSTALLAGTGIASALSYFTGGKIPFKALALGVGAGSGLAALGAVASSRKRINDRTEIAHKFDALTRDSTDANALRILATRNFQVRPNPDIMATSGAAAKAFKKLQGIPDSIIQNTIPAHLKLKTFNTNISARTPNKAGVSDADLNKAFDAAEAAAHKPIL